MKAFGDSHMQALGPRLQRSGVVEAFVANPGWTLRRTLDAGLLEAVDSVIEFGTNEVFNGVSLADYMAQLERAAALLDGHQVVLVGPPSLDHGQLGAVAMEWDALLAGKAKALGWRYISSLEVTQGTWRYEGPDDHGIHQLEAGYSAWADHIVQVLQVAAGKPWIITEHQLYRSVKELSRSQAALLIAPVKLMLREADAQTPQRAAHVLAQTSHESMGLLVLREVWGPTEAQLRYERPRSPAGIPAPLVKAPEHIPLWQRLGNTELGDGRRYCGKGFIQLTGRDNYRECGQDLGLQLEAQPDLAAQPEVAARSAAWYWRKHQLNRFADVDDVRGLTLVINGFTTGLDDRMERTRKAQRALGVA